MKFDNLEELKKFLQWCKHEKMQQVNIDGMLFVFSNLAHMEDLQNTITNSEEHQNYDDLSMKKPVKTTPPEEDDDLYYSVG